MGAKIVQDQTKLQTFLFVKKNFLIGGIEVCMYNFIVWLVNHHFRVIYVKVKGSEIHPSISNVLEKRVEVYECDFTERNCIKKMNIPFSESENVLAYVFSFYYFSFIDDLKVCYPNINIHSYYWLAHYEWQFIEDVYPKCLRPLIKPCAKQYVKNLERNNNIIYLHKAHEKSFIEHYCYKTINNGLKYADYGRYYPEYCESDVVNRYDSDFFLIVSIARLSFPHKGYMIGLLKEFSVLRKKYKHVRLRIIGDGEGRNILETLIESFDKEVRDSIELVGSVFFDDLGVYCKDANLNISLAGGVSSAAMYAVPSLVVRHSGTLYTCEAYGFLPESKDKVVCTEPGNPVLPYIEDVMNMTKEQYLDLSQKSYNTYYTPRELVDEMYIKQMNNLNIDPHKLSPCFMRHFLKTTFILAKKSNFKPKIRL